MMMMIMINTHNHDNVHDHMRDPYSSLELHSSAFLVLSSMTSALHDYLAINPFAPNQLQANSVFSLYFLCTK